MLRSLFVASALFFATPALACPMADAAAFARAAEAVKSADGAKVSLAVEGLKSGGCSEKVTMALKSVDGVTAVAVDYQTGRAEIAYDAAKVSVDALLQAVSGTGYTAEKADAVG